MIQDAQVLIEHAMRLIGRETWPIEVVTLWIELAMRRRIPPGMQRAAHAMQPIVLAKPQPIQPVMQPAAPEMLSAIVHAMSRAWVGMQLTEPATRQWIALATPLIGHGARLRIRPATQPAAPGTLQPIALAMQPPGRVIRPLTAPGTPAVVLAMRLTVPVMRLIERDVARPRNALSTGPPIVGRAAPRRIVHSTELQDVPPLTAPWIALQVDPVWTERSTLVLDGLLRIEPWIVVLVAVRLNGRWMLEPAGAPPIGPQPHVTVLWNVPESTVAPSIADREQVVQISTAPRLLA